MDGCVCVCARWSLCIKMLTNGRVCGIRLFILHFYLGFGRKAFGFPCSMLYCAIIYQVDAIRWNIIRNNTHTRARTLPAFRYAQIATVTRYTQRLRERKREKIIRIISLITHCLITNSTQIVKWLPCWASFLLIIIIVEHTNRISTCLSWAISLNAVACM